MDNVFRNDLSSFGTHAPRGAIARILEMTRSASASWTGKRRAFVLRKIAVNQLSGRPLDVETLGARMRLYPYNNVCEKRILFTPQYFDPAERDFLASRLRPDFVFIDIGANVGAYSLFVAARAGADARILAVEPQTELFERLIFNIRQNAFATIKALDCAVADCDGEVTLFVDAKNRGETSMRFIRSDPQGQRIRVAAKALSTLVAEEGFQHIDAIKSDVEGGSDLILEPFLQDAPDALLPRVLVIERAPFRWSKSLADVLQARGYVQMLETRANLVFERA
jgi:FkbM family methyltransferase